MEDDSNQTGFERRTFLKATGAAGAAAALSGITTATPGREPGAKENELLVGISSGRSFSTAQTQIDQMFPSGVEVAHENRSLGYMAVQFPDNASISADSRLAKAMEELEGVRYVEPNYTMEAFAEPNDPKFGDQYAPQLVNAPAAWDSEDGSGVTIAVVDQGVKYDHPDLQNQFGSEKGKDFVDGDSDPIPDSDSNEYHGTHVAGIAAATRDNDTGVAGMSNATILSGRALSEQGRGSTSDIADAVQWAADRGADIINMSLGGGGRTETMKNAVSYALENGALPICAAGNSGERGVSFPAKYDECVAVGAIDQNEELTSFSQYGPNLDVVAPGQDVLSTSTRRGGYERLPGTSMACPATSGVAALGLGADPDLSPTELRQRLKQSAVDIGLSEDKQGAGRVDARNIVGGTVPPGGLTASIEASSTSVTVGTEVAFDGSGSSDSDGSITSYEWDFGDGSTATGVSPTHTYTSAGEYSVTLTVTGSDGATDSDSVTITVTESGNEPPVASLDASSTTITAGDSVDFDGSGSSDPDGSIASYDWDFGDGETASGAQVSHTYGTAGEYTATLTVTDDEGASTSASTSITVESAGGTCGDAKATSSAEGYLYGYYDSAQYSYGTDLENPCQVALSLEGPVYADFDLYITTDGRTPTPADFDKRSISPTADETIVLEGVSADQEIGILVDSYRGSGPFRIAVEELGK